MEKFMDFKGAAVDAATKGGVAAAQAVSNLALSAEATLKLSQASKTASDIATLSKTLPGLIGRTVAEIAISAQEIIDTVRNDPRDFQVIRSFFDYNLGKAKEVVEARKKVGTSDEATTRAVDKVIGEILESFDECKKKCKENDIQGAAISAETLSRIIRSNI